MGPFNGINPVLMDNLLTQREVWDHDFHSFYMMAVSNILNSVVDFSKYIIRKTTSPALEIDPENEHDPFLGAAMKIIDLEKHKVDWSYKEPTVWFELLDPSSLPGGRFLEFGERWTKYRAGREALLKEGAILVELHYIPCGLPATQGVPVYPSEPNSKAYHATVSAGPTTEHPEGRFWYYAWGVDETMPAIPVPLLGTDVIQLDLQAAYDDATTSLKSYLSYDKMPPLWDCYREDDQDKIAARLMTYLTHLDNGTLPADSSQPPALIADFTAPGIRNELEGFLKKRLERRS